MLFWTHSLSLSLALALALSSERPPIEICSSNDIQFVNNELTLTLEQTMDRHPLVHHKPDLLTCRYRGTSLTRKQGYLTHKKTHP